MPTHTPFSFFGILAVLLLPGFAVAALIYFHFHVRPASWHMRIITLGITLVMSCSAIVCLFFISTEYADATWAQLLLLISFSIPVCYVAALIGWLILFLSDGARIRIKSLWSDPPDIFFSFYWTERRLTIGLIAIPVFILAVLVLFTEIANSVPSFSVITLPDSFVGKETYHFRYPSVFRLNETSQISVQSDNARVHGPLSCTLYAPGFDLEAIPRGRMSQQLLLKGRAVESPDCLWIATARQRGAQTVVLTVSSSDSQSIDSHDKIADVVDIEVFHVVGEIFAFHSLLIVALLTIVLVGLLRFARGDGAKFIGDKRETRKSRSSRVKIQMEAKLFDGETKL